MAISNSYLILPIPKEFDCNDCHGSSLGRSIALGNVKRKLLEKTDDSSLGQSPAQFNMDKLDQWPTYPIIFVSSSTGDGDPPENTETFWRQLRRKTKTDTANLDYVRFIMLGLGDSNYDNYQGFPLSVYAKLTQLGAKPILEVGKADEATGSLEDFVEPWITDLWADLDAYFLTGAMIELSIANLPQKPAVETSTASTPSATPTASASVPAVAATSTPAASTTPASQNVTTPAPAPAKDTSSPMDSVASTSTPAAPVAVVTPAPAAKVATAAPAKAARAPIAPKPPAHVSRVNFIDDGVEIARFKPTVYPPTKEAPNIAKVVDYRCLTSPDAVKAIYEVSLEIRTGADIEPGEALGLWPENCPRLVDRLIKALNVSEPDRLFTLEPATADAKTVVYPFEAPTTVRKALSHHINFTGIVSKRQLIMLAQYCSTKESKETLTALSMDKDRFKTEIEDTWASVLDVLERFPDCKPDVGHLFDSLSALMPRYYSVANYVKPLEHPVTSDASSTTPSTEIPPTRIFKFIYSLQTHTLSNKTFNGVATGWLDSHLKGWKSDGSVELHVPVFIRPRGEFIMPKDHTRPIIMIGSGTGLAPFLGFIEKRRHLASTDPSYAQEVGRGVLFTGHRHPHMDWIYKDELVDMKLDNDRIVTAFSRFQPGKVEYVQTLMALPENGDIVLDLMLNEDAIMYVCGDIRGMAPQVRAALVTLLQARFNIDPKEASNRVMEFSKNKRVLLDLWG